MLGRVLAIIVLTVAAAGAVAAAGLAPAAAGVVVSGTVSGSDRGFLDGASVTLDGTDHRETQTDADGRFTFTAVARGRYRIAIAADGYLSIERDMEVGDAPVSLDVALLRLPGVP